MRKIIFLTQIFLFLLIKPVYAEKIEKIIVSGNERISTETIIIFGEINLDDDFNENKLKIEKYEYDQHKRLIRKYNIVDNKVVIIGCTKAKARVSGKDIIEIA